MDCLMTSNKGNYNFMHHLHDQITIKPVYFTYSVPICLIDSIMYNRIIE